MRPLIIDIEASGFGRGSYPIEVGLALPNGETHCTIICRETDWVHWDPQAEMLHGISRDTLSTHGKPIVEVATLLNQWLEGQLVYSDAWGNDMSWLALLFDCADMPQRFRIESLRSLMTDEQAQGWHQAKEQVIADCGFDRHRASNDALILQQTFERTAQLGHRQQVG